jgi:hypothetical protein
VAAGALESALPQLLQNVLDAGLVAPQRGQVRVVAVFTGAPQCMQKRAPAGTGRPQLEQVVVSWLPPLC